MKSILNGVILLTVMWGAASVFNKVTSYDLFESFVILTLGFFLMEHVREWER